MLCLVLFRVPDWRPQTLKMGFCLLVSIIKWVFPHCMTLARNVPPLSLSVLLCKVGVSQ